MRKLRLKLEALEVESFATGSGSRGGTVEALESTDQTYCTCETAQTGAPCVETNVWCQPTVAGTCHGGTCENEYTCWRDCTNRSPCTGVGCGTGNTYCDQPSCMTAPGCGC